MINALYFKGNWNKAFKFNVKDTQRSEFTNADGSKSHVDYMCMHREYDYYSADNWQAARIPFGGGGFQFTVILPDRGVSIDDCMESICQFQPDDQMFNQIILDLMLPKFKISHETDMIEALMRLGVVDIFDEYSSDFSGMTDFKIIIDLVKQSVNFELNEDGAEAAAVTIVGGDILAVVNNEKEFYIDRPFLFLISENSTGDRFALKRFQSRIIRQLYT